MKAANAVRGKKLRFGSKRDSPRGGQGVWCIGFKRREHVERLRKLRRLKAAGGSIVEMVSLTTTLDSALIAKKTKRGRLKRISSVQQECVLIHSKFVLPDWLLDDERPFEQRQTMEVVVV